VSGQKVLFVIAGSDQNVSLSGRNLQKTKVITASNINTLDVMHADVVLYTESAVAAAEEVLNGKPVEA
jgi:large subunit ribosomal protein L4